MKFQFKKVLLIELFLYAFTFLNLYFQPRTNFYIIELTLLSLILFFVLKPDTRDSRFQKDIFLLLIIFTILYYVVTYFMGFFFGFVYSTYSRRIGGIIFNVASNSVILLNVEFMRERIIKSGKYYKSIIILSILLFSFMELGNITNFRNINDKFMFLQFILSIFIPVITKNILLTYVVIESNKKNTILYQLAMVIPRYTLGIFPDLGDYISAIIQTLLPIIIIYVLYRNTITKREKIENGRNIMVEKKIAKIITIGSFIFIFLLIYLVSGYGRFHIMSIGSQSMQYRINKGDAVIIDTKKQDYKEKDIIAFKMDGKIIVHRIVKITKNKKEIVYITKGDFNKDVDGWEVKNSNIVGKFKFRILFAGYPSVILSELLSK